MNKKSRLVLIIISCLLLMSLSGYTAQGGKERKVIITLKDKAEVTGNYIYLGEVAQDIKAEENLKNKLRKVKIGASPLPGGKRKLNKDYIMVRLYQNGLFPGQVLIKGKGEVLVIREADSLTNPNSSEEGLFSRVVAKANFIIKQGDLINLLIEEKNIKIITRGKALEAGRRGDKIRVLNISSFKRLEGEVIDSFTVKIIP